MAAPVARPLSARVRRRLARWSASYRRAAGLTIAHATARVRRADIAVFHDYHKPPWGGGNQFLRALWSEFESRGLRLENNLISSSTKACLFNSHTFDLDRLRRLRRRGCRMVHRMDGPLSVYRGRDNGTDRRIWEMNRELADATVFQSNYSLHKQQELGYEFRSPAVVTNAPDPEIFKPGLERKPLAGRKVRLISTSWSSNVNKGFDIYGWLDSHLDFDRFEYTFLGNSPVDFEQIRMVPPQPSAEVAEVLRQHDIYITASRHESCSNSLIEALACGLPVLYLDSGGNPEIADTAGFAFDSAGQIPELLERLVDEYDDRRSMISIPSISDVADGYLAVMGIAPPGWSGTAP